MRAKSVLLLMLALGCGLVASIGITQVMATKNAGSQTPSAEAAAIYVALEDIPTGDLITAKLLKLEQWPKDKVPSGALGKLEDVEGRRPKSKIYAGSPILEKQLLGKGIQGGAPTQIPAGYRAVSVRVDDESGTSNLIRPGDRVDVLLFTEASRNREIRDTCVQTILQDVKVFAVNEIFDLEATDGEQSISARTISLLVTPGQGEMVMLAKQMGKIQLALRSHEDKEVADVAPVFPHELGQSERADRQKEELVMALPQSDTPGGLSGLLNRLASRPPQPAVDEPPADQTEQRPRWTVRVIEAGRMNEVVLESTQETPATDGAEPSGFSLWRKISSSAQSPPLTSGSTGSPRVAPPGGNAGQTKVEEPVDKGGPAAPTATDKS